MDKGGDDTNNSSGYGVSDKKSSSLLSSNSDVVKQHSSIISTTSTQPSFSTKICLMGQENNLGRPFNDDGGGGGVVGPTRGGANEVLGSIFGTNLQAFDVFGSYPYKSPGVMGFPFTNAQWKELERQAMIYKYMISSVPVPPDLLFPFSRTPDSSASSMYNTRYSKNGDLEPGRCKRTDGKKWRCSRDVAPHQKYCERHLHRGRPRSRKPVEVKNNNGENNKKTRLEQQQQIPLPKSTNEPLLLFNAKTDLSISNAPSCYKAANRDLSLMMETENRWQNLMEPNMGFPNHGSSIYDSNAPIFHQDYVENQPLNIFSYTNYPTAPEIQTPIGFIDAWSIDNLNTNNNNNGKYPESSVSPIDENLCPSLNLSMAMAAGNILDEQMGSVKYCDDDDHNNAISWEPFARGGPLAEALNPGPPSPHDSIGNTGTSVSSPSGVLQRTLFSHSDGSVCNSPTTLVGPAPPPSEVLFQWLN